MSKTAKLLKYLKAGKTITPWKAWNVFHIYRLADVIYKFRRRGIKIDTIEVTRNGEKFAKYKYLK